jgi:thiamine biosynthesis lipoprotein
VTATLDRFVHVEHVMGTAVTFDVRGERPPASAIEAAVAWLHRVDAEFSTYRPDSAVSRFARGEAPEGADLRWIVDRCERLREQTGGFFDAYATGSFDPSALVKGWAVQRAADGLRMAGVGCFCLNAGGDVVAAGRPWRVGIRHPLDAHAVAAVVEAEDLAIATSALYERGDHVVAPGGRRPDGVLSVTVTGPDLGIADAYATAALAMGADGPAWALALDGYKALTILADETVRTTPGFPA